MSELSVALDIRRPIRYARARVYSLAVRVHYLVFFSRHLGADLTGSGRAAAYTHMQIDRALADVGLTRSDVDGTPSPVPAPLCTTECEAVGGESDCVCLSTSEVRERVESRLTEFPADMVPAPFTGTPYDPNSEED